MKTNYLKSILITLILCLIAPQALASDSKRVPDDVNHIYQWMVTLDSVPGKKPDQKRRAFLWVPSSCSQVRGIVVGGHNQLEEGIFEDPIFRNGLERLGFAELWVSPDFADGGIFDVSRGAEKAFIEAVTKLSDVSGYNEIKYAPVVYISHSAQASNPWNFGAWNPERALALISFHGDSPRSTYLCCNHFNPDWRDKNIDGIPGLICVGSEEFNEFRIEDSFKFMKQYPNSLISFLCNDGRGHSDYSQDDLRYLVRFIEKAAKYRMPEKWDGSSQMPLKKLRRSDGWAADRWHKNGFPASLTNMYNSYNGPKDSCYWYFDEEMARWTESIYTRERNKKHQYIAMMQDGKLIRPYDKLAFVTDGNKMIINAKAVFTDSTYSHLSDQHSIEPIHVKRYCGPVKIVNDTTFEVTMNHTIDDFNNIGYIGMFAFAESDMVYGHAVCPISWNIQSRLKEGKEQKIKFPNIKDISSNVNSITLKASSDSGLPVQYFVQSGPAYVKGNTLIITDIPPRAKYPIKVVVGASQYGSMTTPKVKTAEPVFKTFYITK